MAEEDIARPKGDGHPVITGIIALVAVAVTVGLVLGGGALAATRVLGIGLDEEPEIGASTRGSETLFLPKPEPTESASGPLITLAPDPQGGPGSEPPSPEETSKEPKSDITLSAGQTAVGPMEQIDLTGVYPGGEGAILQVQQWTDGRWDDFPVTASVGNETFSTYIQTSQTGPNRFRMVDTDTGEASNEVRVTIG